MVVELRSYESRPGKAGGSPQSNGHRNSGGDIEARLAK